MIKYYRLFDLLNRRNMNKTDLLEIISAPTLAKLGKGETIKTDIIDRICLYLKCQPEDIMECIEREIIIDEYEIAVTKNVIEDEVQSVKEIDFKENDGSTDR